MDDGTVTRACFPAERAEAAGEIKLAADPLPALIEHAERIEGR
jgi:hypothetical protein